MKLHSIFGTVVLALALPAMAAPPHKGLHKRIVYKMRRISRY